MKTVWYIAKKDLLQTFRDRTSLIMMLIVPIVLIAVIGGALGNFGGSSGPIQITVALSNQDNGYVGQTIEKVLQINTSTLQITIQKYNDPGQVSSVVGQTNSSVNAGVVVPAGTTNTLLQAAQNDTPTSNLVKFYSLPNSNDTRVTIIQNLINSTVDGLVSAQFAGTQAVKQVYAVCNQPGNHCAQNTINAATIAQIVGASGANATSQAQVAMQTAGQAVTVNVFDQTVPGYAVFFCLFGLNAVAATILQEKEDGTFRRLLIAPIRKYALLGGKMLAQFLVTLIQLTILFAVGYLVFHIHLGNIPAFGLLVIGTSFAATGLGIALVSVVKTRRQLTPAVLLVTLITSAIGGAWWPLWLEPTWMQNVAKIGITAWAMEGLNNTMIYGRSFLDVLPSILGLLGYGIICFLIALRFFRFQEKAA
jgi:ABC-2 type transport system permease protein